jgi:hypothetical protein
MSEETTWRSDPTLAKERARHRAAFDLFDCEDSRPLPNGLDPIIPPRPAEPRVLDAADLFGEVIPPREWLLSNVFCREFTSSLLGAGAVGKTAVRIVQALACATGRPLLGEHVHKRCKVVIICLEDGLKELKRRLMAAMLHHGITQEEVRGWLFYKTLNNGMKLMQPGWHGPEYGELRGWLREMIIDIKPRLVILDPFVKLHNLSENDNSALDQVCGALTNIAVEFNIAIDFPHHVRKGINEPGDAEAGRGAGAAKDAGRLVYTLTPMSEKEATNFNVPQEQRRAFVRMDPGKVNIAPSAAKAIWFHLISVSLANGTPDYPNGDNVQTVERWHPPDNYSAMPIYLVNEILDKIEAGLPNGQLYSASNSAKGRAARLVITELSPDTTNAIASKIINEWVKDGLLFTQYYHDPVTRENAIGLRVNHMKRPGHVWE